MRAQRFPSRQAGFSFIELILVIALVVMLMVGLLEVFDRNSLLAKNQTQVSEMQQSLRTSHNLITRFVRMAGRGGLPALIDDGGTLKQPALEVRDNVGIDGEPVEVVIGLAGTPSAVVGTDILSLRGVFTNPLYQLATAGDNLVLYDSAGVITSEVTEAVSGSVFVQSPSPTGVVQPLDALRDAIALGLPEALVLVSPVDESIYAVVELNTTQSDADGDSDLGDNVEVAFTISDGVHPEYKDLYASGPTDGLPELLTTSAWIGILEEYRFYVRDNDPGDPMLSMARLFPGTETPYNGNASLDLDIAENIRELQVALGFDSSLGDPLEDRNGDDEVDDEDVIITESDDGQNDDWLYNSDEDDPTDAAWTAAPGLYYLRLSTLARVRAPDRTYLGPQIDPIENNVPAPLNTRDERLHRRQLLRTLIDLRNL